MEEKILIQSERYNTKKWINIVVIVGLSLLVISCLKVLLDGFQYRNKCKENYREIYQDYYQDYLDHQEHSKYCSRQSCAQAVKVINSYPTKKDYVKAKMKDVAFLECYEIGTKGGNLSDMSRFRSPLVPILLSSFSLLTLLIAGIIHLWLNSYKLTVTNKRAYGVLVFGKRVDLPIDSVSSVSFTTWLKCCSISTSSGNIKFLGMKNYQNIYECLNRLLIERQEKNNVNQNHYLDATEEIIKYKKLLDEGILTKEEFENKKKDILK